jgi:hypothetical protein
VEVKPLRLLETKAVRNKLQAVAKRFEEQGRRFRVMAEDDIRRQPLLANLQRLHSSSKRLAQTMPNLQLSKKLSGGPNWKLENLSSQLLGVHNVLRLVQSNHLQIDLEKHLTDDSDVWAPSHQGGTHGAFRI